MYLHRLLYRWCIIRGDRILPENIYLKNLIYCIVEIPEHLFNKLTLHSSHPIADICKERCSCLNERVKDIDELVFQRVYFYTRTYPTLFACLKTTQRNNYMKYILTIVLTPRRGN